MKHLFKSILLALVLFGTVSKSRAQSSTAVLECMGAMSAVVLYNTYITVGSIADMYAKEVIKKDYAATLSSEQIGMMQTLEKAMQKAIDEKGVAALKSEDKAYFEEMLVAVGHLKQTATFLEKYIKNGNSADATTYDKHRNAAWDKIAVILDLGE